MPSTTITGLASGIEWGDTVDLLMQIEAQPLQRILQREDEVKRKQGAWVGLQEKVVSFKNKSEAIDSADELLKMAARSNDQDILTVTADSDAVPGNHTIDVNQLAQAETEVHDGFADINTTAVHSGSTGTFNYSYGGTEVTLSVGSGTTIAGLVQLINNDSDNPGVTASYIDDGSGGATAIHLVLQGNDPGSSNTIVLDPSGTTNLNGGTFDSTAFTETRSAQDAEIKVDGYPTGAGSYITRESNQISDVIPGVTLYLRDTSASSVEITVENDLTSIKSKINSWVDAYNSIMKDIASLTYWDEENEVAGVLNGDSRVYDLRSRIQDIAISEIPGLPDDNAYSNLAGIGLNMGTSGQISVNDSTLTEALEDNLTDVANLFIFSKASESANVEYFARTRKTKGGTYAVSAEYSGGKLTKGGTHTIGGYEATVVNTNYLLGAEDTPIEGLRLYVKNLSGAGTLTTNVRIGTGAGVLGSNEVNDLTDTYEGLFTLVNDAYDDELEAFETQIENYERRLEQKRQMLERQFLAMENAVSEAQTQGQWLNSI
ncbi:flagellar filament capping protein FliD [bacterium]|nr:flagellar filament capping protein FliD [bacterium]